MPILKSLTKRLCPSGCDWGIRWNGPGFESWWVQLELDVQYAINTYLHKDSLPGHYWPFLLCWSQMVNIRLFSIRQSGPWRQKRHFKREYSSASGKWAYFGNPKTNHIKCTKQHRVCRSPWSFTRPLPEQHRPPSPMLMLLRKWDKQTDSTIN